jgi:hypothetical protein
VAGGPPSVPVTRACNMLYTMSRASIEIDFGGASSLIFSSLAPGDVPTSSSAGTPSPEGYVDDAGDPTSIEVYLTGGAHVGHFPAGFFFTSRATVYATGVPIGGPIAPQVVYCHDDLTDGSFTRCDTLSVGP